MSFLITWFVFMIGWCIGACTNMIPKTDVSVMIISIVESCSAIAVLLYMLFM